MRQKQIQLRKTLKMSRFRDLMFKFLLYTEFDSNYISILISLNLTKNVNKEFINENINLGKTQILNITNNEEIKSFVNYISEEINVHLLNKNVKPKDRIIITYFKVDEKDYKNQPNSMFAS